MADIRLAKPAAGTTQTVPSAPDGRFIFDFPADAATLTRNGDDLVLTFEDGAAIQLQGFYTTYSKEEMPSFQVDGVEISGQDFFAALDEDLMPAAGPASGSSAARGGRYNEYGGSDLLDGLDHLGRLDIGFDGGTQLATDTVEPSPYSEVDHGVTVTPSGVGAATEVVTVYEAGLEGGSQAGEKDAPTMAGGSLSINAPDGVASIVIGGVVVFENGALTGKGVSTDEGTLSVTGYDPATGKLDFSYSLDRNTTEHVKSDPDTDTQISHTLVVTVTDTDGDSGSTTITVNVVDDAPTAVDDTVIGEEAQAQQGVVGDVLENDKTGADGLPNAVTSVKHGDEESMAGSALKGAYGELTLNADGTYTYKLDKNVDVEKGKSVTETFTYTITDADGDTSEATLTITIRGDEKEPVAPGEDKAEIVVDEGALSDGSGQHAEHGILGKDSFTVNLNGEDGTVTLKYGSGEDTSTITLSLINGENFTSQWLSENKTLTVNGVKVTVTDATQETPGGPWKIEYTYELTGQQAHKNAGSAGAVGEKDPLSDSIDITVTDATGDMTTGSLMVTVHDDGPVLTVSSDPNDTLEWTDGATGAYTTESGSLTLETGADGLKADSLKVTDAADPSKSATFDAEGKATIVYEDDSRLEATYDASTGQIVYTYTPGAATQTTDRSFMFSALDTDDDSASATVSIKVDLADSGDVPATVPSIEVDESGLADGTTHDPGMITKSITLPEGYTLNTDGWVAGEDGALTLTVNDGKGLLTYKDGELTYTLQGNYAHADATNPNEGLSDKPTFDLNLTHDATGVEVSTTVTVDVLDDAPVLTAKIDTQPGNDKGYYYDTDAAIVFRLAEGGSTTKLSDIDFGADVGTGEEGSAPARITVTVNNTTTFTVTVTRDAGGQLHFSGENSGTITFDKTGAATGADDGSKLTYDTATGQFTYTRPTADVGGTANEYTFTLTVTDADGDTVQQTGSVVTVFREPTITGDAGTTSSTVTTDEGNLEQGSDWEIDATEDYGTTASGTLTVNLDHADGTIQIGSLIIGVDKDGNVVSVNSNPATSLDGETVPGDHGHLSNITVSKADADGTITISYDYTLTEAVDGDAAEAIGDNTPGRGESMQADSFAVTVTANGHTATGSITANALDDAPVLTAFWMDAQSSDTDSSIHGQLDFVFGADAAGATLTVEVGGTTFTGTKHGSEWTFTSQNAKPGEDFRMNADGIFTYSRPTADVQDHKADSYTFNVTVTDGDGDSVSQSMTVTTTEVEPDVSDHTDLVVNEDGLVHDNNSETATGQLVVDLHGQSGTVTIGSVTVTVAADGTVSLPEDVVAEGSYGNLTITNVDTADGKTTIDYSYTLDTLYTHKDDEGNPTSEVKNGDTFKVQVNEKDTGTITVDIIDDVPVLEVTDNALTATGGYASESDTLTLDYGADAPTGSTLTVNGAQGTAGQNGSGQATLTFTLTNGALVLTQMSDHTYTYVYTAKNNTELDFSKGSLSENLTFEITDADGDTSSQTVTVTITEPEAPDVSADVVALVDEADIVDSDAEGNITNRAMVDVVQMFGGPSDYKIVGASLPDGSPNEVTFTTEGLTYTLNAPVQGDISSTNLLDAEEFRMGDITEGETILVTVEDAAGNQFTVEVPVEVIDDVPTINVTNQASGAYGSTVTGSVAIDFGADTGDQTRVTVSLNNEKAVEGEKGADGNYTFTFDDDSTLTLDGSTGAFSYDGVPTSGTGTSYEFTFTVTDADDDTATATTTAEIAPKASYTGTVSSFDNDLLQGSSPSHPVEVSGMPGIKEISDGAKVFQGETLIGEFTLSGNKLFFQQSTAYSHGKGSDSVTLSHHLTVTDEYGKEHIVAVGITIEDSDPYAHNDTFELKKRGEDGNHDAEGNVLDNDTRSADAPTLVTEVEGKLIAGDDFTEITGQFGTLSIKADGTYHYVLDEKVTIPDNSIKREEFTYTITDADGDTSTAAALTILVGKGTVHVKESGIGVNENGEETAVLGNNSATGWVEGAVTSVAFGSTQYSGDIPDEYKLKYDDMVANDDTITIYTNYGDLVVNKMTGNYTFMLDDDAANPLPEGFEIHQGFTFTTTVDGVTTPQEVVVVIEGTNDAGRLSEAGDGGHTGGNLWIDAKAEGADSVEVPYHAKDHPNLGNTDSGDHSSDLDRDSGGTARPTAWLPFTLEDLDFGDSLTFQAVYTGVNNDASGTSSMEGENFVSYVDLLKGMESDSLSVALSVEWGKFQQNFSAEQLGKMQFYRNEYGIFAITSDAVDLEKLTHQEGAQYWLTFLADSDHDVFRQMAEGRTNNSDNGMILHFSFQVKDKTGNTVQTSTGNETYVNTNNVLVHVYGSNDTPEVKLEDGALVVHDDDVNTHYTENVWQDGKYVTVSKGDPESHTITINYGGKTYTGTLKAGTMTLESENSSIRFNVLADTTDGTNFVITGFSYKNLRSWQSLSGQLTITITDGRDNSAMYMVNAQDGQLVDIPGGFTLTGTEESENLYGGSGVDQLYGQGGNDSLWGGAGDDYLYGQGGNDRLYGEAGNDTLQGGDGLDILVGGDGSDSLDGGAGDDVLIGDGQGELQSVIEGTVNAETFRDFLDLKSPEELESYMSKFETENDGNDTLEGGDGNDLLFGMGGNDQLDGGDGNDLLFGGSGDDYIDGGEGRDTIYAGDGNDIIVYDSNDYLVSGGSGIDFMVSDDSTLSLTKLLQGTGDGNGPIVDSIEVLITGKDALSLTSLEQMAKDYGISINGSSLELDSTLWAKADNGYRFTGDLDNDSTPDDLFLQVNSKTDAQVSVELVPSDDIAEAVQRAEIEHSNG